MRGYFFIYKRILQSGNKIYYIKLINLYLRGRGDFNIK